MGLVARLFFRYSSISVSYHVRKIETVRIDGQVNGESDFEDLRATILLHDFPGVTIYWNVKVQNSGKHFVGTDEKLFAGEELSKGTF